MYCTNVSIHSGLGLTTPRVDIDDYTKAIDSAFAGRITVLHRMRLSCSFQDSGGEHVDTHCDGRSIPSLRCKFSHLIAICADWQVMNEIALHRGSSPHLNTIDVFVDGQHLTEAVVRTLPTVSVAPL